MKLHILLNFYHNLKNIILKMKKTQKKINLNKKTKTSIKILIVLMKQMKSIFKK